MTTTLPPTYSEEFLTQAIAHNNAQWMKRIIALEADRKMLREALESLADEFVRVYPIYYYAEPWAHNTNVPLLAARTALRNTND